MGMVRWQVQWLGLCERQSAKEGTEEVRCHRDLPRRLEDAERLGHDGARRVRRKLVNNERKAHYVSTHGVEASSRHIRALDAHTVIARDGVDPHRRLSQVAAGLPTCDRRSEVQQLLAHSYKVRAQVQPFDCSSAREALRKPPGRHARSAAEVDYHTIVGAVRAKLIEGFVKRAAEQQLAISAAIWEIACTDSATSDLTFPSSVPAEVAFFIGVERLPVVLGNRHV
mmetsp:Transcript_849/g.1858  ORF Transcript_849/g.1858 Transcript_849/m.1858 type:complete len:226 (+) Transcript_849:1158-1835(+)